MRSLIRTTLLRPLTPRVHRAPVTLPLTRRRSFTRTLASLSTSGYGDVEQTGNDSASKQGSRPRIDTEHPGREPVDEGKGTGSGGYAETGEKAGGGREGTGGAGKDESVAGSDGDKKGGGLGGKSVSDMKTPDEGEKGDVEKHNKEYDRQHEGGKDEKVEKEFWSGELLESDSS